MSRPLLALTLTLALALTLTSVRALVSQANVNEAHPTTGATGLIFAAMMGHVAACQVLLEARAATGVTSRKGKTALGLAQVTLTVS